MHSYPGMMSVGPGSILEDFQDAAKFGCLKNIYSYDTSEPKRHFDGCSYFGQLKLVFSSAIWFTIDVWIMRSREQ